jgi:hypothetical protein
LRTSLCLQFGSQHIAADAIYLAAKFLNVNLPSNGDKIWWQYFGVTPRQPKGWSLFKKLVTFVPALPCLFVLHMLAEFLFLLSHTINHDIFIVQHEYLVHLKPYVVFFVMSVVFKVDWFNVLCEKSYGVLVELFSLIHIRHTFGRTKLPNRSIGNSTQSSFEPSRCRKHLI